MRDAIGGLVNLVIIVVFMVILSGYLAFNVNYTKAFKVKNKIISTYEEYEGNCYNESSACVQEILAYMKSVGFDRKNMPTNLASKGYTCSNGYCYLRQESKNEISGTVHYKIVTQITLDIPIINKVMRGLNVFQVSGSTSSIHERKN